MQLPRPRLRLRILLIAVALAAISLGAFIEWRRLIRLSETYRQKAELEQRLVGSWGQMAQIEAEAARKMGEFPPEDLKATDMAPPSWYEARSDVCSRRAAHHARLHQKYLRAAARPWLSVAPDPPEPPMPFP
jgi:hypothetical protein